MISNVLGLNETTRKYQVTFNSEDEKYFRVHIGGNIVNFPANEDLFVLSKLDMVFSKIDENKKIIIIEGIKISKPMGKTKSFLSNSRKREH